MIISNLLFLDFLIINTAFATVVAVDSKAIDLTWQRWKQKHAKQYVDSGEEQKRRGIWQQQVDEITQHNLRFNMGLESYKQGLNKFSDLTWEELEATYLMSSSLMADQYEGIHKEEEEDDQSMVDMDNLPSSVDWRTKGYVTSVKDQGSCGSCWAFAAVGSLEGQMANKTKKEAVSLSPQQLVDCSSKNGGCNGGWSKKALKYTQQNGVELLADYAYIARQQPCNYSSNKVVFKNSGSLFIKNAGEERLAEMVANRGPVTVSIQVITDFFRYKSGIYSTRGCQPKKHNHAVLTVGYATDYWLVKNTWGQTWGEQGYIRMARNRGNMCNIASWPVVPII